MNNYYFLNQISRLKNGEIEAFAISGNSYVRNKVYDYCDKNALKTTRAKSKVCVVVCKGHKCICVDRTPEEYRCYHTYSNGERCLTCNYTCPEDMDEDHYCDFAEVRSKLPVIYIHRKDIPIEKLREIDKYPMSMNL